MIYLNYFLLNCFFLIFTLILMLIGVAFLTLFERKILGHIQDRKGPNKVGMDGLFQPFSDVVKLLSKEFFYINGINKFFYLMSSMIILFLSMLLWLSYLYFYNLYLMNYGIIYILMIMSFGVYPIMFGGWSSNSNYSMLGCLRSVAQSISYEVSLFLILFLIMLLVEGFSFKDLMKYNFVMFILFMFPLYLMFIISLLIELNRTPFDLIEGESELVSGFNTEYFGGMFSLIFMAEYLSIIFMSYIMVIIFFSMKNIFIFVIMWLFHIFLIIWIRGVLPRIRYDELMFMCWKKFLMISLFYIYLVYIYKFIMIFLFF